MKDKHEDAAEACIRSYSNYGLNVSRVPSLRLQLGSQGNGPEDRDLGIHNEKTFEISKSSLTVLFRKFPTVNTIRRVRESGRDRSGAMQCENKKVVVKNQFSPEITFDCDIRLPTSPGTIPTGYRVGWIELAIPAPAINLVKHNSVFENHSAAGVSGSLTITSGCCILLTVSWLSPRNGIVIIPQ